MEKRTERSRSTESPAAVSTYMLSPQGCQCLITVRGDNVYALLELFESVVSGNLDHGYQPLVEGRFKVANGSNGIPPDWDAPICAVHGTRMTRMESAKGGYFWSCHERLENGGFCTYKPPRSTSKNAPA